MTRRNTALARHRLRHGLTQQQLADAVNDVVRRAGRRWSGTTLDGDYVSRLETGRITWPNAVYRAAFREVLGATTDAGLGFYCQHIEAARAEVDSVRRRDFMATLPAVALPSSSLGELVAAATAQPVPPPRRVGLEHAAQVRAMVGQADVLDNIYGGGLAHEIIAGQARWAVGLLDASIDHAARAQLPSAVGYLCRVAGWSAYDFGLTDAARQFYAAALRCAEQADDWPLRAGALSSLAQIAAHTGRGDNALTFAQQAAVRADRLGPVRRVWITLQEARAHAHLGDAQASLAAIGRSEDMLADADPANDPDMFAGNLSPAELMGYSGRILYIFAQRHQCTDTAVSRLRQAVATYPADYPRSRVLATAWLATLLMHTGDPAEAVQLGHQALDAAGTMRSARVADSIRHLHGATARHRLNPDVDDLRHRAAKTLAYQVPA